MVVVAVEEAAFLLAVQRGIRRVKVQDQSLGRLLVSRHKLLKEHLVDRQRRVVSAGLKARLFAAV